MRTETAKIDIKDAILDAAERLLGLYGYAKTTVDDIAHEAGIGKGTIYLHFHSKEEIAVSWIGRINERVRARLSQIAESDGSPAQRLREMLVARVMVRFDNARNHDEEHRRSAGGGPPDHRGRPRAVARGGSRGIRAGAGGRKADRRIRR